MSYPASGYVPCACRDCMETAIADVAALGAVCHACEDAGCADTWSERVAVYCARCGGLSDEAARDSRGNVPTCCGACGSRTIKAWPLAECQVDPELSEEAL